MPRPRRMAECHPDRPHLAKGLCSRCYGRQYRPPKRAAECEHAGRPAHCRVDGAWVCKSCYDKDLKRRNPGYADRQRENARRWRESPENKAKAKERQRHYYAREDVKEKSAGASWRRALARYGLEPKDADLVLERQGGGCGICGTQDPGGRRWDIDHCHETGEFRGLLCGRCNKGLGLIGDNIDGARAALRYLDGRHLQGVGDGDGREP